MSSVGPEYLVRFTTGAFKELEALDRKTMVLVDERACGLAADPFPAGMTPLKGRPGQYRIRQGDYRIVYLVNTETKVIIIATIGHRREVYER